MAADDNARVLDAREALRKRDRVRLAMQRTALQASAHPLAVWADYWELWNRLSEVSQDEIDAFYARWPGSYLEDRLRNDWLLELGHRRNWRGFAQELPRFRMNDDREVSCYAQIVRYLAGEDVRSAALAAWLAQREADEGCNLLATTLVDAKVFSEADIWTRVHQAAEANRPRVARQTLALLADVSAVAVVQDIFDQPQRYLNRHTEARGRIGQELVALALVRQASSIDPVQVAAALEERWQSQLPAETSAWVWSVVARQGAMKLLPDAEGWYQRAAKLGAGLKGFDWSDEALGWRVRAALRAADPARWQRVLEAIDLMSPAEQRDPTWVYWKARALQASAPAGADGDPQRFYVEMLLEGIANQFNFYGKLASEDLGRLQNLPPRPAPLSAEERLRAEQHPGLSRALALIALGLRDEGKREWNFSMREMSDRELLAAAQRACEREVWDRCIYASERTRTEIDFATRFPTPFRAEVTTIAQEIGVDPAYVYGLIRQESRFVTDARSGVGAAGLMQLMPATAKWTARKLGMAYSAEQIHDRLTNLRLGTGYLKLVLDDFNGSQTLAAAAYNAGPTRSRRWREGPTLEVAVWAENIPFNETRDYVKKVLSNASYYAALMNGKTQVMLKPRLGAPIGPRPAEAVAENRDLP
ncbi:MAG: transglycosylase SLT domain-containing protein [Leptothrix sp. (in: b-proteobacteria)]